ncbi:MAG: hypothetical protein D6769_03195 [Methanobacteriota archaeon]|nr:MAG: hypothetical protein D6769_03195 [Euryarchaeota archaeon]
MDKLIRGEITLRELSLPSEIKLSKKNLIKWLALSLGLINPGESRNGVLAVLQVMAENVNVGTPLSVDEIVRRVNKVQEMSEKNVYYHLKKLKELDIISKVGNGYVVGDGVEQNLDAILIGAYKKRISRILENVEEAARVLQSQ